MATISLIVSITSLLFGLFTFLFYDNKLKQQAKIINEYTLKKHLEDEVDKKKAQVAGNFIKVTKGSKLKVFNSGKSPAYNVRVEFVDDISQRMHITLNPSPYEKLDPQNGFDIFFVAYSGNSGNPLRIKFIWDDDFEKNRINEQVLQP